ALYAGEDRRRQLLRVRGGEQELDVAGRLLERLEQRVERRAREHLHFVDDVDLVAVARRHVLRRLAERPHVVDAVVRRGVDLLDIDVRPGRDVGARPADAARFGSGSFLAVQRSRQDPRRRGLAASARTGEEERVRDPAGLERVDQGADHVLLARQVLEALRPVFAGKDEVRGGHRRRAPRVRGTAALRVPQALDRRPGTRLKTLPLLPSGPGGFTTRRRPIPGPAPRGRGLDRLPRI